MVRLARLPPHAITRRLAISPSFAPATPVVIVFWSSAAVEFPTNAAGNSPDDLTEPL